jgi:diaminopimelate epimerase
MKCHKFYSGGNDFLYLECDTLPSKAWVMRYADRIKGIGFDQLLCVQSCEPYHGIATVNATIMNGDGSVSGQCLNGVRSIGAWWLQRQQHHVVHVQLTSNLTMVVTQQALPYHYGVTYANEPTILAPWLCPLTHATGYVGDCGNPHVVFFSDTWSTDAMQHASAISMHPHFPEGVNVSWCCVKGSACSLRTYERGVGWTQGCGSATYMASWFARHLGYCTTPTWAVHQHGGDVITVYWQDHSATATLSAEFHVIFTNGYVAY